MKKYIVTMIIDTDDGYPSDWDWGDLLDGGGKHNVSHVMSHRIYPFPVSSQDRERYDIPHVDEIQQAFEESEREYEMRDEVYPDDNI